MIVPEKKHTKESTSRRKDDVHQQAFFLLVLSYLIFDSNYIKVYMNRPQKNCSFP